MLDKGGIVELALIKLGETGLFNDDRDFVYQTAVKLLDDILDTVAGDKNFLFNAVMVELTRTGRKNALGMYEFNKPTNFMNEVKIIDPDRNDTTINGVSSYMQPVGYFEQRKLKAFLMGEFYYSNTERLVIIYCRKINLQQYPDYMKPYLIYALAVALAQAFTTYSDKLNEMYALQNMAMGQVQVLEGSRIQELEGGCMTNAENNY